MKSLSVSAMAVTPLTETLTNSAKMEDENEKKQMRTRVKALEAIFAGVIWENLRLESEFIDNEKGLNLDWGCNRNYLIRILSC